MVSSLYDMIEKDGLKDPYTGKPAINFLDRSSFVQKLNGHAQEFQMAVIIVKEFFMSKNLWFFNLPILHYRRLFCLKPGFGEVKSPINFRLFCTNCK